MNVFINEIFEPEFRFYMMDGPGQREKEKQIFYSGTDN
jgi:hypothetical protein